MNIREELQREHSKKQTLRIASFIQHDAARFDELMQVFLGDNEQLAQRAAWCLRYAGEHNPTLYAGYLPQMLALLKKENIHNALRRNIVRVWEEIDLPEEYHGEIIDCCINIIEQPSEHVAVKCYAMSVLAKLCAIYPELKPEADLIIRRFLPHPQPAFNARARKVCKQLQS